MLIEPGSEDFKRMFLGVDLWGQFVSELPAHEVIVQSLADPSLDPYAENSDVNLNLMNYQGVKDLQVGTRRMLQKIVLPSSPEGTFGFLQSATGALEKVMEFNSIPEFLQDSEVYQQLGVAPDGKPLKVVGQVAFAAGMSALTAMGPVGAAAAAIVGFVAMLAKAFGSRKAKADAAEEEKLREAYLSFPPLQEQRSEVDTWMVNSRLLPTLQTGDWTAIFLPRFRASTWTGIPRLGGYAMAPGKGTGGKNALGEPEDMFEPSGGVGYWPGENRITSIIQVKVDPLLPRVQEAKKTGLFANHTFNQSQVQDVGDFLLNTNRLSAIAWEWVSKHDRSPHLFKVNVQELHDAWAHYCRSAVELIRHPRENELDFYKGAIACSLGSWQCTFREGQSRNIDARIHGWDMSNPKHYRPFRPGREREQGCVIGPVDAKAGTPNLCLGNIYDLKTRLVLDQLAERQRWFLRHSLLCAYVRRSWAAFRGNSKLTNLLDEMRMLLLDHPDRRYVVLTDVPPDEKLPNGRDLKKELIRRGAGKKEIGFRLATNPGTLVPPKDAAPSVPSRNRMPFDIEFQFPDPPDEPTPWWKQPRIVGAGLGLAVGGGLWLWNHR